MYVTFSLSNDRHLDNNAPMNMGVQLSLWVVVLFPVDIDSEVRLLDHMGSSMFTLLRNFYCFSQWLEYIS
jgi:hypothetical protein